MARELVEYTYRLTLRGPGASEDQSYYYNDEIASYRRWLRKALPKTQLGRRLAYCDAFLPDIVSAMPFPLDAIARLTNPRSLHQLLRQLVCYLDWYVEPDRRITLLGRLRVRRYLALSLYFLTLLICLVVSSFFILDFAWLIFVVFPTSLGIVFLLRNYISAASHPLAMQLPANIVRQINAEELLRHLKTSYSISSRAMYTSLPRRLSAAMDRLKNG